MTIRTDLDGSTESTEGFLATLNGQLYPCKRIPLVICNSSDDLSVPDYAIQKEVVVSSDHVPHTKNKIGVIIGLAYINFWMAASISVQAPFFPKEAESKGATPTQYGLVFGIYELVILIMSPVYGRMIPKTTPKCLITSGALIAGSACILFGILDGVPPGPLYISLAFLIRIVEGVGEAALFTATFTIIAMEFSSSVATSFSLTETAFGIGLIVGPTIGGALYQVGGFMLPFIVNGVFLILGSIILSYLLPKSNIEQSSSSRSILSFLYDGGMICYALAIITCLLAIGFNDATLEPHLRKFELSPISLGCVFVVQGGTYALTTPFWGYICDKGANPLHINIIGYILTCTGILLLGPVPFLPFETSLLSVILSLLILGLGLAAKLVASFVGALQNTIERGFPDNLSTYGMVSAFFSSSCSTGGFFGPSLGGLLLDTTGYSMGTTVIFSLELFCMLLLLLFVLVIHRKLPSTQEEKKSLLSHSSTKNTEHNILAYSSV